MKTSITPERKKLLLEQLETSLLQSVERLDRGEGVDGELVFKRLRRRIKKVRSHGKVHI